MYELEKEKRIAAEAEVARLHQELSELEEHHQLDQQRAGQAYADNLGKLQDAHTKELEKLHKSRAKKVGTLEEKVRFNRGRAITAEQNWTNVYRVEVKPLEKKAKIMEAERDVATEQVDTEQKARKSAEKAKVQADKRVHSVHRELNQIAAMMTKTNDLMAKAATEGLKHRADVLWVQGRKEAFITEDQIYAARSSSDGNVVAQRNWEQCSGSCRTFRVKIKSSVLYTNEERAQCYGYVKAELERNKDGMVEFKAPGAIRGLSLLHIPKATASSADPKTVSKTLQRRNRMIDVVFDNICAKQDATDEERQAAITEQLAAHMKRHRQKLYQPALKKAKIIRKADHLTLDQAAMLKNSMTDTLWRHVKSMLDNEVGLKAPSAEKLTAHTKPTQIPQDPR